MAFKAHSRGVWQLSVREWTCLQECLREGQDRVRAGGESRDRRFSPEGDDKPAARAEESCIGNKKTETCP